MIYICAASLEILSILLIIAVSDNQKTILFSLKEWLERWKNTMIYTISFLLGMGSFLYLTAVFQINWIEAMQWQIAITFLMIFAEIDQKKGIIPNRIIIAMLFMTTLLMIQLLCSYPQYYKLILTSSFSGGIVSFLFLLICSFLSKGGFGAGDIKLIAVLGFLLGLRGVFNVFLFTMIISAVTGIVFMLAKKKNARDCLPLAPFLLIGVLIPILLGI